ncbi:hypothetical protein [Coralloluteibacterium thermophilus]|uniref:Integral membrane protein n=1 Tax=Coralloluteibacterium thermophilum TaxID=2707049 RepID=A0ABV9NMH5_9GAMM
MAVIAPSATAPDAGSRDGRTWGAGAAALRALRLTVGIDLALAAALCWMLAWDIGHAASGAHRLWPFAVWAALPLTLGAFGLLAPRRRRRHAMHLMGAGAVLGGWALTSIGPAWLRLAFTVPGLVLTALVVWALVRLRRSARPAAAIQAPIGRATPSSALRMRWPRRIAAGLSFALAALLLANAGAELAEYLRNCTLAATTRIEPGWALSGGNAGAPIGTLSWQSGRNVSRTLSPGEARWMIALGLLAATFALACGWALLRSWRRRSGLYAGAYAAVLGGLAGWTAAVLGAAVNPGLWVAGALLLFVGEHSTFGGLYAAILLAIGLLSPLALATALLVVWQRARWRAWRTLHAPGTDGVPAEARA